MSSLKVDTLLNRLGTKSVPAETIIDGSAKAWVNFDGTGTPTIRRAFNVSSITDGGVGTYTVNFVVPFADQTYAAIGSVTSGGINSSLNLDAPPGSGLNSYALRTGGNSSVVSTYTLADTTHVSLAFFR